MNSPVAVLKVVLEDEYGVPVESRMVYEIILQYVGLFIVAEATNTGYGIVTYMGIPI